MIIVLLVSGKEGKRELFHVGERQLSLACYYASIGIRCIFFFLPPLNFLAAGIAYYNCLQLFKNAHV